VSRAARANHKCPIIMEFENGSLQEFNERTYRYDYHASLFLARKSYARIVVKTTLLVSFLTVPQNEKQSDQHPTA